MTQVLEDNSFCSLRIYVNSDAVPPPSECPITCGFPRRKEYAISNVIENKYI